MKDDFPTPDCILEHLKQCPIGCDRVSLIQLTEESFIQCKQVSQENSSPKILISETNLDRFLAKFIAAIAANCNIFLCKPDWGQQEWQQVFAIVRSNDEPLAGKPKIMIPTGGSSGNIRFAIHTWETLTASVKGFCQYFDIDTVNSFCVLPIDRVAGLMQFVRSFLTKGSFVWSQYKEGNKIPIDPQDYVISLVPTQLQFLLQSDPNWLSQFNTVLLGGAPAWQSLLQDARKHRIKIALTYGMTETASQIATLKPEAFLNGNNSNGRILPHAKATIDREGIITIASDSLCLGYYPNLFRDRVSFQSDDLGYFDEEGYLYIVGRNSQKIITGGENVFPAEVESAILATRLVIDVAVIGLPDEKWGQAVTAICIPINENLSKHAIETAIAHKISKFKQPKHWLLLEKLPRDRQGKINYQQLQQIALDNLFD